MKINKECAFSSNEEISELKDKCKKLRAKIKNSVVKISELISMDMGQVDDEPAIHVYPNNKEEL